MAGNKKGDKRHDSHKKRKKKYSRPKMTVYGSILETQAGSPALFATYST